MSKLRISSIQRGCVYDGPGVRTTIFLKGCCFHCPWCCNPENISVAEENFVDDKKCIFFQGMDSRICIDCERRGGNKSISKCPFGVSVPVAQDIDSSEVYELIERDKESFGENGGVTFSGGEPLLQAKQLTSILQSCKANNVHVLFETTLFVSPELLNAVLPYTDNMIVDLKLQSEQGDISRYLKTLAANLAIVERHNIAIHYRLVFVNSMLSVKHNVLNQLKSLKVVSVELIKCHNLGKMKYEKLQQENHDFTAADDMYEEFALFLNVNGIVVSCLTL